MEAVMKAFGPSDRIVSPMIAGLSLLLSVPAIAIVGGAIPSAEGIGRSVITIVGSRGNFCTGVLIAPKLVLTVAHCVQPGAVYKIVDYGQNQQPQLHDVRTIAIHPAFNMQAIIAHRASADLALLQLESPPQESKQPYSRHLRRRLSPAAHSASPASASPYAAKVKAVGPFASPA